MSKLLPVYRTHRRFIIVLALVLILAALFSFPAHAAPHLQAATVTVVANPTSLIEESGNVDYTITVRNNTASPVLVTNLTSTQGPDPDVACGIPRFVSGNGQFSCTYTATINGNPGAPTTNTITATVGGVDFQGSANVSFTNVQPSATLNVTPNPVSAQVFVTLVTYTVQIENTNNRESITISALTDTVFGDLNDPLNPFPFSFNGCVGSVGTVLAAADGTPGGGADYFTCAFGVIFNPPATPPPAVPSSVFNVTTVTVSDNDGNSAQASDNTLVPVTNQVADLAVTMTSQPRAAEGETVDFTITVTNNGPDPATTVGVTTVFDPRLTFVSQVSASQGLYNSSTGVWNVGTLLNGNNATLVLRLRVNDVSPVVPPITLTSTATITQTDQADPNQGDNQATTPLDVAVRLGISKQHQLVVDDGDLIPEVGETIGWLICVQNLDPLYSAANVLVTDTVDSSTMTVTSPVRHGDGYAVCPGIPPAPLPANSTPATPNISVPVGTLSPSEVGVVYFETLITSTRFSEAAPPSLASGGQQHDPGGAVDDRPSERTSVDRPSGVVLATARPVGYMDTSTLTAVVVVAALALLAVYAANNLAVLLRLQSERVMVLRLFLALAVVIIALLGFGWPSGVYAQENPTDTPTPTGTPDATTGPGGTGTPDASGTPTQSETTTPEPTQMPTSTETATATIMVTPKPPTPVTPATQVPGPGPTLPPIPTLPDQLNTATPATGSQTPSATPTGRESISGVIWLDMDGDGTVSAGDVPAPDIVVALYRDDGNGSFDAAADKIIGTQPTDAEGGYRFERLEAGNYWVVVDTATLPKRAAPGQSLAPQLIQAPGIVTILLVAQPELPEQPAAGTARVKGLAFNDNNGNRLWDGDIESGIRYVDVVLFFDTGDGVFDPSSDTEVGRTTTSWDGLYTFDGVGEGRFWVMLDESTLPPAYMDTIAYGGHGIQNPQELIVSNLPRGLFAGQAEVEGPWFAYALDTDGDGSPDGREGAGDRDSDGIPNYLDAYDPSGTIFSWDGTFGNAVPGVTIRLFVDQDSDGIVDPTEPLANTIQANPQVTPADGSYRFDINVTPASGNGIPNDGSVRRFILQIDQSNLPATYSFTPRPWAASPPLNVPSGPGTFQVSPNPYPPNAFGQAYHMAFDLQVNDQDVVNNHVPLNVSPLQQGWQNTACARRSAVASSFNQCVVPPAFLASGVNLNMTFQPNAGNPAVVVGAFETYTHRLTNTSSQPENFVISFPAGSQAWNQTLRIRNSGGSTLAILNPGQSYTTTTPLAPTDFLEAIHEISPRLGAANGAIDVTVISARSLTDSRLVRRVTDVTGVVSGCLSGRLFDDNNRNGTQDAGEPGIVNGSVFLLSGGAPIANVFTNANGDFSFTGIPAGANYRVLVDPASLSSPVFVNPPSETSGLLTVAVGGACTVQNFAIDVGSPIITDPGITKTGPSGAIPGQQITFTLQATNPTSSAITNVVVTDVLNSNLNFVSATTSQGTQSFNSGTRTATFTIGTMNPGATVNMTIVAQVASTASGGTTIPNQATMNYLDGGGNPRMRNSSTITVTVSGPTATPTVTATLSAGQLTATSIARATSTSAAAATSVAGATATSSASTSPPGSAAPVTGPSTLPLTGSMPRPSEARSPAAVLLNALVDLITVVLVVAGLTLGVWGLLLYFRRVPPKLVKRFGWLRDDRIWYTGSIVFTLLMTAFIFVRVIAPTSPQVAATGAPEVAVQPVQAVAVAISSNQGTRPAASPDAMRHVLPDDPATRIIIPRLEIDTDLVEAQVVGHTWDVSTFFGEVAHLEGTAHPGTMGNAVLAGHVRHEQGLGPFRNAGQLQPGDLIIARGRQVEYVYEVVWSEVVEPTAMEVVAPSNEALLTLITCTDWDNASWTYLSRLVVRARLVEVRPL